MKYWFKNVADNIYIYPKSAPRNLILQTRTSDCNSALILILWLRERIYEIGIFLSIGTSKIQIIMQFIFELIFISIPSIISSLFLGNVLLKVIVDGFINSEDSMISGGSLINNSSFMLNITTLGQSYLILISIIVLSVVFASSLILIKKPKEILSKIS